MRGRISDLDSFATLSEVLLESGETATYYLPNPGNAGDALIDVGFVELAAAFGLSYVTIDRALENRRWTSVPDGAQAIIGGGGGLVPEWSHARMEMFRFLLRRTSRVILLPMSAVGVDDLILQLRQQDHVFCREMQTYRYVRKLQTRARVHMQPDLATFVDPEDLLSAAIGASSSLGWRGAARDAGYRFHIMRSEHFPQVRAFRCDEESLRAQRSRRRLFDFSQLAYLGMDTADQRRASAQRLLSLIDLYDHIETDRLHVAIGGALLGKTVRGWPSKYGKIEAVYEYSLVHTGTVELVVPGQFSPPPA